jgi:hypothetical protein
MKKFLFLWIVLLISCKKENEENTNVIPDDGKIPVVMVHGFLASGDTYSLQIQRFCSNGYNLNKMYTFDWNSLGTANSEALLNKFIDNVLAETGAKQVDLMGHSAGSGLVYSYCKKATQAAKVAHLVLLAGFPQTKPGGPNGELPTLNIYSTADAVSSGGGNIPNAQNLKLTDKDHYEVATCFDSFEAMYKLFNATAPTVNTITAESTINISGKALSFGENLYVTGTKVSVFEVSNTTGFRISETPVEEFSVDKEGFWGPLTVKPNTYYEFLVTATASGSRPVHYYFEPFKRSNNAIYLRSFPAAGSLGAAFLGSLPKKDEQAVTAFFGASQAAINGRDILTINTTELSTPLLAKASNTTIALFVYDANNNAESNGGSVGLFATFPFLKATDEYIGTENPETITYSLNGRNIRMKNWKSKSEGVSVAVFE